ncbi:MAG: N-6 DNA methylase [Bacteroidia bacterium]|nr:N-6 DNA methylase [Bacteroidia bacterium]
MANERKTESIVRSHFEQFKDIVHIEEQLSDNPIISKLLKTASKKAGGIGKPEFLITFAGNSDLIIVVECKAEITKHESKTKDKFSEYAVDGALLYASYISKEFDVLAIGISGQTNQELKVSHFLQLKNERKAVPIFGNKLLTGNDYLDGYLQSPEKFRQDYNTLLEFTKKLNDTLHSYKILESQRSLLISCILIALENKAFKTSYHLFGATSEKDTPEERKKKIENAPKELANYLVDTVSNELKNANIKGEKLENLDIQFGFIRTDTSLSTKKDVLKNLIKDIDENINSFIKTHKYFDVLGQLYIEFLRYANSDKGLGIVLTPPHITELFAELAQVNPNSVVYDNCTGTGGFLISAMKKMIADASGNQAKIREIKNNQLFGTEYQAHIFALTVSNMYIHQDGKTNIINGNCFDEEIMQEIKNKNPTVGFLNPPYKGDKKKDIDELEFVLNNLECLVDGGTCIAIVPMERALATKGKVYELKKKLLEHHTLEAVLSLPDELFTTSKASSVTCAMIFTAHRKHSATKKTYFGYYKDDGFEKRKNTRIDAKGKWKEWKDKWVKYYNDYNRKEEAGFSINKIVTADDDWSVENYLETDYSKLTKEYFITSVRNYLSFCIKEGYLDLYNNFISSISEKDIKLESENWNYFKLSNDCLFEIKKGKRLTQADMEAGETYFIGSSDSNNGLTGKVGQDAIFKGNTITVNYDGSVAEAYYQPFEYWALDSVNVFYPKFELNPFIALFITTIIRLEKYRFNYGRKWGLERMKESVIKLPTKDGKPDFEFMEKYIKSIRISK